MRSTATILSRSQRRNASRQGALTVLLLIVIGAAGFLLGFLCGRWSAPVAAVPAPPPPMVAVVRPPAGSAAASAAPVAPAESAAGTEGATVAASASVGATAPPKEEMTYYETLTKGEPPPLGSGINLPPPGAPVPASAASETRELAGTADKAAIAARTTAKTPSAASVPGAAGKTVSQGKVAPVGKPAVAVQAVAAKTPETASYVVQTASFRKADDAEALKKRLEKKRFSAFVEAIEVSGKGIWHRVLVGPFSNAASAEEAARQLKGYERMTPVVKKR